MPAVSRARHSTRAVSTRRRQQEEGHCRHLGGPGHGSQCAPTTTAPWRALWVWQPACLCHYCHPEGCGRGGDSTGRAAGSW